MNKTLISKIISSAISIFVLSVFFFLPQVSKAAVLLPGNIASCGELASAGTYTLTQNISGGSDTCLLISSNNVVIQGGAFTISGTGTSSPAIDGRAYTSSTLTTGAHGYTNLVINDLSISGYTTGIDLSGNSDETASGVNNGYGGDGGDVAIYYSFIGSVISNGGTSSSQNFGGLGGNISFTDTDLNISNSNIQALGGTGTTGRNTNGGLDLNYSGTLNITNTILSELSFLNNNATTYNNYPGGSIPIVPGNISSCGTLIGSGEYTLTQNLVSTSTCFTIGSNGITINGNGYSITAPTSTVAFFANASTYSNFTLASTTVNVFTNLITSSSSVTILGHDLDLSNKFIAAESLTINYTGILSKIGATISSLANLTSNGVNYGAQLAGQLFVWIPRDSSRSWRSITSNSNGDKLAAVAYNGQIYTSEDSGVTWTPRDSSRGWYYITSNSAGDKLAAVVISGQIYTSTDSGVTWTAQASGSRNWISITSNSTGDKLAAVVNGGQIYTSTNSGVTWTPRDSSREWRSITSNSTGDKLAAVVNSGQIYTSTNSGVTWTPRESSRGWTSITSNSTGDKLAAVAGFGGSIYTSTDYGVTWTPRGPGGLSWVFITSNSDGTKLVANASNEIYTSTDSGVTWTALDSSRNWYTITSNSAGDKIAAGVYGGQIYTHQDDLPELKVDILLPEAASSPTVWQPTVSWGSATSCYYSYDNFVSTSTANCASLGSDISNPILGSHTLYVKGIDVNGVVVEKNVAFTLQLGITKTSPTSGSTVTSWNPAINWDPASYGDIANCYYSYNNFVSTSTANCLSAGADILPPSANGTTTLSLKVVNSAGDVGVDSVTFTYTAQDVWTPRDPSGAWRSITSNSTGDKLAAVVDGGQIYTSTDSGVTWTAQASGSRNWYSITSNSTGDKLAAVVYGGQIYTSTNSGVTWTPQASGSRNWYSITSNSTGDKLAAVVNSGQIYTSTNSGVTWTAQASGSRNWFSITSNSAGDKLAAVVYGGQIYTSTNSGVTWTAQASGSRNWFSITSNSAGDKLAAVVNNGQIYTSTNSGVTWTPRDSSRQWRFITSNSTGDKLAAVVYGGQIYTSTNSGATWTAQASGSRNWYSITSNSTGDKLAAGVYGGQIYTSTTNSDVSIIRPTIAQSVIARAWSALVNWGSSVTCYYSYNNWVSTSTANCASNGNDIAYPLVRGANTLYLKGVDALSVITNNLVTFDFDSFVWTARDSSRNWFSITSNSTGDKLAAVDYYGFIYTSTDSGVTWTPRDSSRGWYYITSNSAGDKLAAVVISGQIYTSTDSGVTWTAQASGSRNWISITSNSTGDKLAAVVYGGQIYTSEDSGVTWTPRDSSREWQSITSNSTGDKLAAVVDTGQIYTSTNSGVTWTARDSSRNWISITSNSAGDKLAAVVYGGQIYTSTNSGVTWTPQASGSRNWFSITSNSTGDKLAAVVNNGQIYTSTNSGVTWTPQASGSRQWRSITSNSTGDKLAAVAYSGQIYTSILAPYISFPTSSSTVALWQPLVEWSNSITCEYSYDNSTWSNASCIGTGSDIDVPLSPGPKTLYIKGTDFLNVVSTSSVSFTYLATQSGSSVTSCGNISSPGTYTLTQNITGVTGSCFIVSANNVTINGGGFTVTAQAGNTSYAVTSGSYTGLNLQDITFSGFGQGIISSSETVTYSGTDVDLTNSTTTVLALFISYTNNLTALNTYFSNLSSLIINNIDLGNFVAGLFTWNQQDISTCQTLSSSGSYRLTADITNVSGTCFVIASDRVIIDGNGHAVSGANGNTNYAIVATSTNANAYTGIGVKNLTLTGFGGGVDARGADGISGNVEGKAGGKVSLHTVIFPTNTISANTEGGNGFYENNNIATGSNAGNVKVTNSTIGTINANGGDTVGNTSPGANLGNFQGGSPGTITTINSTVGAITTDQGAGYVPGCIDNNYNNYNSSATYDDGSCTNLAIGSEIDNPLGNTVSGPIDFNYYNNYGVVTGDANFYDVDINEENVCGGKNYGTTTGFAYFNTDYCGPGGAINIGYVGGGADFGYYSDNNGTVDGNTAFIDGNNFGIINGETTFSGYGVNNGTINGNAVFLFGVNNGTINGNADFTQSGNYIASNYGIVNGDAIFFSNDDNYGYYNQGTVTGNVSYFYGCTDVNAINYNNAQNDNGSCLYYGINSDLPAGVTFTGDLNFNSNYSNYGTVIGDSEFSGGYNLGTVTGLASINQYTTGINHDDSDNTLYVDGSFDYYGTGVVGGQVWTVYNQILDIQFLSNISNDYTTTGNVTFNDTSYNSSTVIGTTTFNTTYYASTTPSGGVMSFEINDYAGSVNGQVLGSDAQPITTYVFYGNTKNTGNIVGNAVFFDYSYNAGNVTGNVTYMNASNGTLALISNQQWAGTVTGTIKGVDGVDITNLIFNDTSSNQITIASTTTAVFNDEGSNEGIINGNASFNGFYHRIGTVNGTATLGGIAQTLVGVSNIINFVKNALTRDTLFLNQGATLNISGLATIFGVDANNLLTVRSSSPNANAEINFNGTLNTNFLRIKNITNSGLSQDLSTKTIFDDGSNTGFTFKANTTPSTRSGGQTSSYPPPALPPSHGGVVSTPSTPSISTNTSNASAGGSVDKYFVKKIAPLIFKRTTRFDSITGAGVDTGRTILPSLFKGFKAPTLLDFKVLQTNFLKNVIKFVLDKDNDPKIYTVKSNNRVILSKINYDKKTDTATQSIQAQPNQQLDINVNTKEETLNGTFNGQSISLNKGYLSVTLPKISGTYILKIDGSRTALYVNVIEPVSTVAPEVKRSAISNWINKIKSWFR